MGGFKKITQLIAGRQGFLGAVNGTHPETIPGEFLMLSGYGLGIVHRVGEQELTNLYRNFLSGPLKSRLVGRLDASAWGES